MNSFPHSQQSELPAHQQRKVSKYSSQHWLHTNAGQLLYNSQACSKPWRSKFAGPDGSRSKQAVRPMHKAPLHFSTLLLPDKHISIPQGAIHSHSNAQSPALASILCQQHQIALQKLSARFKTAHAMAVRCNLKPQYGDSMHPNSCSPGGVASEVRIRRRITCCPASRRRGGPLLIHRLQPAARLSTRVQILPSFMNDRGLRQECCPKQVILCPNTGGPTAGKGNVLVFEQQSSKPASMCR